MADKTIDTAEQLQSIDIKNYDLTKLEKMFYTAVTDPEHRDLKEIADYAEKEGTPQRLIFNAYNLAFILDLAAVAADWSEEDKKTLLDLLQTYKDTGKLSKEDIDKLGDNKAEAIKELVTVRPGNYLQTGSKADNSLFTHDMSMEEKIEGIKAAVNKKDAAIKKYVYINLEEDENLTGLDNLTEFDKSVHNAVISMFNDSGERIFTARQVTQFLFYGNDNINRASPKRVEEVDKSIKKLMRLQVTINFKEHAELNKLYNIKRFEISRYILPLDKIKINSNGDLIEAYSLMARPPILEYVQQVKQIISTPTHLLDIPVRSTHETIIIRDFLLEQIGHIKNNREWNNIIKVDRIIDYSGIDLDSFTDNTKRKKRKIIIDNVCKILDSWKKKEYIKGYVLNKGNRGRIDSIKIIV